TAITLKWKASKDDGDVTGYRIYRDGVKIKAVTGTNFTVKELTPGTRYTFAVRSADDDDTFSKLSKTIAARTSSVATPAGFTTINAASFNHSSGVNADSSEINDLDDGD